MFGFLKSFFGWILPKRRKPKPAPQSYTLKVLVFAPLAMKDNQIVCSRCGEPLPDFLQFPGIAQPYAEGMLAACHDLGMGANPHWQTKNVFALAGWNLGWLHAVNCGNKKETACST